MKRYVIQARRFPWENRWETFSEYDTLEQARAAFERLPFRSDHRIAESYTVIRYKEVK